MLDLIFMKMQNNKSKDLKMNLMKKISLSVATVAILATSSFSGQVLTGGNIALINNITGLGVLTLDLGSSGADVSIATFIVNNNSADYDVDWTLTNGGQFESAGGGIILMSDISIIVSPSNSGTLGTGGVAPNTHVVAGAATWGVTQTTATENYMIEMTADWTNASTMLAGLYTEQIVFTITATL
jgi:hypothetical protein